MAKMEEGLITLSQAAFMLNATQIDVLKLMESGALHLVQTTAGSCTSVDSMQRLQKSCRGQINASE